MANETKEKCRLCNGTGRKLDSVDFGKKMKARRLRFGISASYLARTMGVSGAHVSNLESGKTQWTTLQISRYKEALDLIS